MKDRWDFIKIIAHISYKDWDFNVEYKGDNCFLVIRVNGVDSKTNTPLTWNSRKWYLSPHMTDSEVIQTAFLAVKVAEEHEIRERFKYKNQLVFGPHIGTEHLVKLCSSIQEDSR